MNKRNAGYWITTGLVGLAFLAGGAMDALAPPEALAELTRLGYPLYFARIIGVWKLLGAAAVLAPGLPRLKEWAYAGFIFDLTGAAVSHLASGDGVGKAMVPLLIAVLVVASWALRPASRKLVAAREERNQRVAHPRPIGSVA